jgi:hypothetical protein
MHAVGWRQPVGGESGYLRPGHPLTLAAPSECVTPIAEYTFPEHLQHAQVARHSVIPVVPHEPTLEPRPELSTGPVHPLPQGLLDLLHLRAEPLGAGLAPDRKLARPRRTA